VFWLPDLQAANGEREFAGRALGKSEIGTSLPECIGQVECGVLWRERGEKDERSGDAIDAGYGTRTKCYKNTLKDAIDVP
jgi:hypothetical protein